MSDLYDDDILWWSEQQAELLRRVAAGERVNDQLVEEIESWGPPDPLFRRAGSQHREGAAGTGPDR